MADDQQHVPETTPLQEEVARRTHHRLELEFGKSYDFDDPKHEWRRLFSELLRHLPPRCSSGPAAPS